MLTQSMLAHLRRRTSDVPLVTIIHGANADCPDVQAGRATRCPGHHPVLVGPEGPAEHCRNALAILRFTIDHDEPLIGNGCPAIAVPITSLARIQARLETVIEQLEAQ